jgi:hypothetical protein
VNKGGYNTTFSNPLNFETFQISKDLVNFVEEGVLTGEEIDLAINEFDPSLRSSLNFMNNDSIKCLILDNGITELRATLHY